MGQRQQRRQKGRVSLGGTGSGRASVRVSELDLGSILSSNLQQALQVIDHRIERTVLKIGRTAKLNPYGPSWATCSLSSCVRRDLPMPGSPLSNTACPVPSFACSHRRRNNPISSSLPTKGPAPGDCCFKAALSLALAHDPVHRQRSGNTLERL